MSIVRYELTLPDPKELIELMLNAEVKGEKVRCWVQQEMERINESRKWSRDKIFWTFATCLLARRSQERWWEKLRNGSPKK